MNNSNSPAGWHPDPHFNVGMLRWWDGSQWTEHTRPTPPAQPAFPAAATVPAGQTAYSTQAAAAARINDELARMTPRPQKSLIEQNSASCTAIGVAAGYILLVATTGVVLLGIVPVLFTVRAFNRGEKLAPFAAAAAALAVLLAVSALSST